ncbi:Neprilysin-1 [Araneus ventricosus]|uniref:Neprilysin-1 n=1 Tax=Araneus ventricosus TaxID=182803 RepID=A0A4Y2DWY7_ARAVE|nr:Neprilysin-1 [Araneus ventricosus]
MASKYRTRSVFSGNNGSLVTFHRLQTSCFTCVRAFPVFVLSLCVSFLNETAGVVSPKLFRILLEKCAVSPALAWIKKFEPIVTQDPMTIRNYLVQIEAIGDKPLRDVVRELGGWPVSERDWEEPEWPLEHLLGQLRGDYNQGIIIEQWVGPDDKNSSVNVIQLDQMSFGLPSREYFLKDSSERERKAYLKLMVEVAILFGADREMAEMDMTDVLDLEIRLANASILCS